jgi:response regulator RpfG family c-di-GMP phosphodiesterase
MLFYSAHCREYRGEVFKIVERSSTNADAEKSRPPVVLIVEDEFAVRSAAAEYLRDSAYSVIEASNVAEAMSVFTSGANIVAMQIRDMLQSRDP